MSSRLLAGLLLFVMLVVFVHSQTLTKLSTSAWCSQFGTVSFPSTDQTSSSTNDFDYTSTYFSDQLESVPLFVKKGTATTPFTFASYTNANGIIATTSCTGSQSMVLVKLINEYLFLTSSDGKYYVCKYIKGSDSVRLELSLTGLVTNTLMEFYPYMTNANTIYALASSSTMSRVVSYTWNGAATTPLTAITTRPARTPPFQIFSAKVIGGEMYLYDAVGKAFYVLNAAETAWATDTTITTANIGTRTVASYSLRDTRAVITLTQTNKRGGSIYSANRKSVTTQLSLTSGSTIDIQYFTDNQHNFVRVESANFFWLTVRTPDFSFTFFKTSLTATDLGLSTRGLSMASILHVGLSQNKATIIYDTGVMDILRQDNPGGVAAVKTLFTSVPISGNPVLDVLQSRQFSIKLSCYCEAVKKHMCFSRTLNCVIVNKAGGACGGAGDTYTAW